MPNRFSSYLSCIDFYNAKIINNNDRCCGSCHDDNELGYEMCWTMISGKKQQWKDGIDIEVCCGMANKLGELNYGNGLSRSDIAKILLVKRKYKGLKK